MRPLPTLRLVTGALAAASLLLVPVAAAAADGAARADTAACDDALVTFTRDGTTGDDRAVALTAQSIERGAAGWDMVGWESAPGTQLTAVVATDRSGEVRHLGVGRNGVAEQVTSLTFCGTVGAPSDADDTTEVDEEDDGRGKGRADDRAEVVADPPAQTRPPRQAASDTDDAVAKEPARADARKEDTSASAPDGDGAPDRDARVDPTPEPSQTAGAKADTPNATRSQSSQDAPDTPTAAPGDGTDATGPDEDAEEVEVLGVRVVASPDVEDGADDDAGTTARDDATAARSDSRPVVAAAGSGAGRNLLDSAWLLAAAIAAGIVAGGSALRVRRTAMATNTATGSDRSAGAASSTARSGDVAGPHGKGHR